jgi:hypothetical protein
LTDNPLCCSCWYRRSQSTSKLNRLYLQPSYCRSSRPHARGSHRSHPAVFASHSAISKVGHGIPTDTSQQRSLLWFPSPFPSYWLPVSTRQSLRLVTEFLQLHRTLTAVTLGRSHCAHSRGSHRSHHRPTGFPDPLDNPKGWSQNSYNCTGRQR